jgi:bifunctional enzyme CysN/CysC
VVWEGINVTREERESRNGHRSAVVWFTGLSGSGKTTIARAVERRLFGEGRQTMLLDGDHLRHGLTSDLAFSPEDRAENIRRVGEVAKLFYEQGSVTLCTFISPYRKDRDAVRAMLPPGAFLEIFVDCDIEVCRQRDPKGHYAKAASGELTGFTGVSSPYEPPEHAEMVLRSDTQSLDECVETVLQLLQRGQILP